MNPHRGAAAASGQGAADTWFVRFQARRARLVAERKLFLTVALMSVVALPAFALWFGAKLAWNHDPPNSQQFRPVETSALTVRPKDTALQFHHALNTLEFGEARLLATTDGEALVLQREEECERSGCSQAQAEVRDALVTRATVLRLAGNLAVVRAETFDGRRRLDDVKYDVARHEGRWLVSRRHD